MQSTTRIGCIADDFTGASDIGSFFVKGGLRTSLFNGIPDAYMKPDDGAEVLVIALKSRSIDKREAVGQSLDAFRYLKENGCNQIYFKYCSTFDSTREGNIGPVADALLECTGSPYTVLCPSLPVNGRTVKEGGLYVHGVPLHESPMKDHPVTPMWDYRLSELMAVQSSFSCLVLSAEDLVRDPADIRAMLDQHSRSLKGMPFYVVPDYYEDSHGEAIAVLFRELPLITGGSGLAEWLAAQQNRERTAGQEPENPRKAGTHPGRAVIFAGSCSTATREQIGIYKKEGGRTFELSAGMIDRGDSLVLSIMDEIRNSETGSFLVHTSGNGDRNDRNEDTGLTQIEISSFYEKTMAELAETALANGIRRIIIAGGETSGAVTERLGFQSFILGESVAPGVPVLTPMQDTSVRLVLKSGNFGQPDFFRKALLKTESQ